MSIAARSSQAPTGRFACLLAGYESAPPGLRDLARTRLLHAGTHGVDALPVQMPALTGDPAGFHVRTTTVSQSRSRGRRAAHADSAPGLGR